MIKIIRSGPGGWPNTEGPQPNFIPEIKFIRAYITERYGVTPGLREVKGFIEHIQKRQESDPAFAILMLASEMDGDDLNSLIERLRDQLVKKRKEPNA